MEGPSETAGLSHLRIRHALYGAKQGGNFVPRLAFASRHTYQEDIMGRGLLLWLIGIPLPIILIIWLLGGLHG